MAAAGAIRFPSRRARFSVVDASGEQRGLQAVLDQRLVAVHAQFAHRADLLGTDRLRAALQLAGDVAHAHAALGIGTREGTQHRPLLGGQAFLIHGAGACFMQHVGALVQVATLAVILELAKLANPALGGAEGAFLGFVVGVGLGAFASLSHRFFGQANGNPYSALKVWLIEVGQDVFCLTVAGLIIGAWQ